MAIRLAEDVKRNVLGWGTVSCNVLDASHIFVHRSTSNAHVDAFAGIFMRGFAIDHALGPPLDRVCVFARGSGWHPDHGCRDEFPSYDR